MLGDRERSGAYASEQRRLVRASVAAEVLTYTPYWREAAAESGLRKPSSAGDLTKLSPRPLSVLGRPDSLVLRPPPESVRKTGPRPLRRRLRRARLGRGRATAPQRILDPLYKPIHWLLEGDVPVGCTEADLIRLAELGRRSLELAGITPNDAIVGLVPAGPTLSSWQLALGAREAGVPLAGLAPSTSIEAVSLLGPTVLAGHPPDLLRILEGLSASSRRAVTTVFAITRAPLLQSERLGLQAAAGSQAEVVSGWAPPGVRALWTQCRGGEGVHTWPQAELLEVCGRDGTAMAPGTEGELVWTGLGWRGTVVMRLATGVWGRMVEGRCETCGRTTARILDAHLAGLVEGAEGEGEDFGVVPLGSVKATGPFESVRTVRTPPPAKQAESAVVRAVRQEDEGVVRAGPKDPEDVTAATTAPPPAGSVGPGEVVDLHHLPPIPEVGPDASGAGDDTTWLPDTGEVDAWPAPVLASIEGLAAWQVEHRRRRGRDELVVHLALAEGAELADVLVALERSIGATQYVVGGEAELAVRLAAADGRRVVDRRSQRNGQNSAGRGPADEPPSVAWRR